MLDGVEMLDGVIDAVRDEVAVCVVVSVSLLLPNAERVLEPLAVPVDVSVSVPVEDDVDVDELLAERVLEPLEVPVDVTGSVPVEVDAPVSEVTDTRFMSRMSWLLVSVCESKNTRRP